MISTIDLKPLCNGSFRINDRNTSLKIIGLSRNFFSCALDDHASHLMMLYSKNDLEEPLFANSEARSFSHILMAPDETFFLAASGNTLFLWKKTAADFALRNRIHHDDPITSVALHPAQKWVLFSSTKEIRIWDLESKCHSYSIFQTAISSALFISYETVAVATESMIQLWDLSPDPKRNTERSGYFSMRCPITAFAASARKTVAGLENGTITVLTPEKACTESFAPHSEAVTALLWLGEDLFVSGSKDGSVKILNAATQYILKTFPPRLGNIWPIEIAACVEHDELQLMWKYNDTLITIALSQGGTASSDASALLSPFE